MRLGAPTPELWLLCQSPARCFVIRPSSFVLQRSWVPVATLPVEELPQTWAGPASSSRTAPARRMHCEQKEGGGGLTEPPRKAPAPRAAGRSGEPFCQRPARRPPTTGRVGTGSSVAWPFLDSCQHFPPWRGVNRSLRFLSAWHPDPANPIPRWTGEGGRSHGLPPQSGTETADTPPSASPRSAVPAGTSCAPAGGTAGETRSPSTTLRLQVVAARASRSPSTNALGRAAAGFGRRTRRDAAGRVDAWLDQPPHNREPAWPLAQVPRAAPRRPVLRPWPPCHGSRTVRPQPVREGCGKRGQQVRRWLERRWQARRRPSEGAASRVSFRSVMICHCVVVAPLTRQTGPAPSASRPSTPPTGPASRRRKTRRTPSRCELVEDGGAFVAHRPTAADRPRRVAFVDGTLRTEARLTRTGPDGEVSMGLAGSWAAGAVLDHRDVLALGAVRGRRGRRRSGASAAPAPDA